MDKSRASDQGNGEGLGLESLLAKVPPPKAPAWFAAKTLARLREEQGSKRAAGSWGMGRGWRWIWAAGTAALVAGWVLWDRPKSGSEISDAMVFAALDALVEQDEENRWWAGL